LQKSLYTVIGRTKIFLNKSLQLGYLKIDSVYKSRSRYKAGSVYKSRSGYKSGASYKLGYESKSARSELHRYGTIFQHCHIKTKLRTKYNCDMAPPGDYMLYDEIIKLPKYHYMKRSLKLALLNPFQGLCIVCKFIFVIYNLLPFL
jgi:hypothetical protein